MLVRRLLLIRVSDIRIARINTTDIIGGGGKSYKLWQKKKLGFNYLIETNYFVMKYQKHRSRNGIVHYK